MAYGFRSLDDDDPLLSGAPLMRALDFLLRHFQESPKGIPLTTTRSFRRSIVLEAIHEIAWHDWTADDIFSHVRVASEEHFHPFCVLHGVLLELGMVRNFKGHLKLSRKGASLAQYRFDFFHGLAQFFLFEDSRFAYSRHSGRILGNWDIWLNVLDIEAATGISGKDLTEVLYGPAEGDERYDPRTSSLYSGVLTPLIWCGLLDENMQMGRQLSARVYTKTALWNRYLILDEKAPRLRIVH